MNTLLGTVSKVGTMIKPTTPQLMSGIGIAGTVSTAVLSARGAQQAEHCIDSETAAGPFKDKVKATWRCYIPAAISGTITIGCIYGAARFNARQASALTAAYALSERALYEYRDKVAETFGTGKEQAVRDEIAQDRVTATPSTIVVGAEDSLTCELHTMRYFKCDMETLRKAQNDINARMIRHDTASLSDLYDLLGIPNTSSSWEHGWEASRPMELEISAVMAENGKPCLAFDYNYTKVL